MRQPYRNWEQRRQIIRAVIAEIGPPPLESFNLSPSEQTYFRVRATRAVDRLARQTAAFKAYYQLRPAQPLRSVLLVTAPVLLLVAIAVVYVVLQPDEHKKDYLPILAACATVGAGAVSWSINAWFAHRNAVRQNTTNIIFARFAQATVGDAMHRFHSAFGNDPSDVVTFARLAELRRAGGDENLKTAASVTYLLNYYEFISAGVLKGDLDAKIIRDNIRGVIVFYYDKCAPLIGEANRRNPLTYEHLIKLRTHYREP